MYMYMYNVCSKTFLYLHLHVYVQRYSTCIYIHETPGDTVMVRPDSQ